MGESEAPVSHPAVLDNTVLSNFALVQRPDLPLRLWRGHVCTTPAALTEYLAAGEEHHLQPDCWNDLPVLELTSQEEEFANQLHARLGSGERACLAVANLRGGMLVTDDLDARRVAQIMKVPISGTLGILVQCVEKDIVSVDEANQLLTKMIAAGYHSPIEKLGP
ncbi:MAG: hypothetical protein P8Y14_23910 [Anaerolineales bacterium]|jgi:predicted nucleic acid-binding protein